MAAVDEIAVRLGLKTSEFNAALKAAGAEVRTFSDGSTSKVGGLFDSLEHRVLGMRHLSGAIATALGLNLEKIAEHVASIITGISEADKKAFEELDKLSDKATELAIKNMRAQLSEEMKYQMAIQDRDRLQKQLDQTTDMSAKGLVQTAKTRIELEEKITEIHEMEKKQQEELKKKEEERNRQLEERFVKMAENERREWESQIAILGLNDKLKALKDDIAIKQAFISAHVLSQKQDEVALALVAKDVAEITKLQAERKKQIAGSTAEELELLRLQHRVVLGIATGPEELRLKQIQMQRKERQIELEMNDLAEKAIVDKLTPAEVKRLAELEKQKKKLDEAYDVLLKIMKLPPVPPPPVAAAVAAVDHLNAEWEKFTGSITQQGDLRTLSGIQLQALIDRLHNEISRGSMQYQSHPEDAQYDFGLNQFKQTMAQALSEQSLRSDFASAVGHFGLQRAESDFMPADFNRLQQFLPNPDQAKKQAGDISQINTTLSNLFPGAAAGLRG